ncbi:MAG: hypothetical protein Q9224_003985 [Gallowayella concinna]
MSDINSDQVYVPTERADVDSTGITQRKRKYADGKKLWKKNSQGMAQDMVIVVSAEYDKANHRWNYTLKDLAGKPVEGTTKESDLG